MKSRALIAYWLLLLASTLAAGAFMLRLLRHEGERLAATESAALQDRARVLADDVRLIVQELKDGLGSSLAELPEQDPAATLRAWQDRNPMIRNAFLWDAAQRRLEWPDPAGPLNNEQAGFLRRYGELFSGRAPWPAAPPMEEAQASPAASQRAQVREMTKMDYQAEARQQWQQQIAPAAQAKARASGQRGWLAWYWEDQLHLLGWQQSADGRRYFGVEVEMAALLSRIATALSDHPPAGLVYALLDGNGAVFAQRGGDEATSNAAVRASVSLGPHLPHWQVAILATRPGAASATGRSFRATSGLLVGVFVAAILSGGSLLLWQARRNLREVQQRTGFVSHVSHELKTPLTTIRMYAEMLAEGRVAGEEKRRGYLGTIVRESERLTRLVNNVLDFSRLEQGRKKYSLEQLDLAALAREVLEQQAERLREGGLALTCELPETPAWSRADRDAVAQCLLNLIDNAIKYAAAGGQLAVRLRPAATGWRLEAEDKGPGIAPAHRARLFEQFHRADDSLTAKVAGFGLGLSIARRLLRDQGGDLAYEDVPGGGARFVMALPPDGAAQREA